MNSLVLRKPCSPTRLLSNTLLASSPFSLFSKYTRPRRSNESKRSFSKANSEAARGEGEGDGEGGTLWKKANESPVYGTGSSPKSHKQRRVTTRSLARKYNKGEKRLTMITAYDYPSAKQVDTAGADIVLVGDSAGMVSPVKSTSRYDQWSDCAFSSSSFVMNSLVIITSGSACAC
jgi:hypothetical protein